MGDTGTQAAGTMQGWKDSVNAKASEPLNWVDKQSGSNLSSSYMNPLKMAGDISGAVNRDWQRADGLINQKGNIANERDRIIRNEELHAGMAAGDAAKADSYARGIQNQNNANKFAADQKRAGELQQNDLNSAMMDAQDNAARAKRGRNKMYSNRLGGI